MKKILLSLLLAAFLLLPKPSFAQAPCNATGTVCGQTAYDTCTPICNSTQAAYDCYQASNQNCRGTILCAPENSRCQTYSTPAYSNPICRTDCSKCPTTTTCGTKTYDTCIDDKGQKNSSSSFYQNGAQKFRCFAEDNPNCTSSSAGVINEYNYSCSACGPIASTPPSPQPTVSPSTQPSTQPSAVPVTVTKITIDDKEIAPQAGSQFNLHLSISDLTKDTDVPVRILVTYSDNTTKPFIINFHYKPKQEAIPVSDQTQEVKVLVLKYFPLNSSGSQLNENITGMNTNLAKIRQYVDNLTQQGLQKLTEGSKFHGYKTNSPPALNYTLADTKEFLISMPLSTNKIPWNNAFRPDYKKMLNDISICDYVDTKGVSQVWVWGYHTDTVEPAESNMSMGTSSKDFWPQGTYGDISNSERIDDMPVCQKTYTLYNYSYQRGLGELLEDHGHHIEAVLGFVDYDLFWNKFVAPHGETGGVNNCGWMHTPPNVSDNDQYNWTSKTTVLSACKDWKPLGDGAAVESIDCSEWGCANDTGASYKVWWMQNLPGINNDLTYQGKNLRNWWAFIGDFDSAIASGKSLTAPSGKFTVLSSKTSIVPQSDNNYVPPASLPHPSYLPVTDVLVPQSTPTSTPEPLKLIDFNNDGVINIFDYIIFAQKKLGK